MLLKVKLIKKFEPDYNNILDVALNKQPDRIPLYEHLIDLGIMEKITSRKIDAKHSNEDAIAPFSKWIEDYGKNIGNFGGVDMDILCRQQCDYIRKYTLEVLDYSQDSGGVAYGTGNSIPYYVPVEGYLTMINTVREYNGNV